MRTLQPILFGTKKGDREDPGVYGIFSVALKRKGTVLACRLSYLVVEKTTALAFDWRPQADLNRC